MKGAKLYSSCLSLLLEIVKNIGKAANLPDDPRALGRHEHDSIRSRLLTALTPAPSAPTIRRLAAAIGRRWRGTEDRLLAGEFLFAALELVHRCGMAIASPFCLPPHYTERHGARMALVRTPLVPPQQRQWSLAKWYRAFEVRGSPTND